VRKSGSVPGERFHDDMYVAIFIKGRQLMKFRHGGVPGSWGVRRRTESAELTSRDKPLAVRWVHSDNNA
jgi:hypothetical protein